MLHFLAERERARRVLALGSHADDIEIGCGATLLALTRARPDLEVTWVVLGAEGERERRGAGQRGRVPRGAAAPRSSCTGSATASSRTSAAR